MGQLLDLVGSMIIGSLVFLMIFKINGQMSSSSYENNEYTQTQKSSVFLHQIMLDDFMKIGYRAKTDPISTAQQNQIKFKYDINNDSTKDSVYYYIGATSDLASTPNPNDFFLYRKVNNATSQVTAVVTNFTLTYLDSTGTAIAYSNLTTQSQRNKIKSISVYYKMQNSFSMGSTFNEIEWRKTFRPKNIN